MKQTNIQDTPKDNIMTLKEIILKLKEWGHYISGQWKIIAIAAFLGSALGFTYAYLKKPTYKAVLSFALEDDKSGGLGGAAGLASQLGLNFGGGGSDAFSGDNLIELMRSRSIVEKTLLSTVKINNTNKTLADLYISFNDYRKQWAENPQLANMQFLPNVNRANFTLKQDSVLGAFHQSIIKINLIVDKIDKKLTILTVTVNSRNELFSKYFAEILVKTVSDFYITTKTKKSAENVSILQHQTDSVKKVLNNALKGVASSADVNPNPNPSLQILRVPSQSHQVDVQAAQAILTQLVANLELAKISLRKETPLIQIIDTPILPLEKSILGKIKAVFFGAFIASLLTIIVIVIRKSFKIIMA